MDTATAPQVIPTVAYRVYVQTADDEWGPEQLAVRTVEVHEAISRPYEISVELLTREVDLELEALLGARFELEIQRGESLRRFPGLVVGVRYIQTASGHLRFELQAAPALAVLAHSFRSRVFQDQSVPQIVKAVVEEGVSAFDRRVDIELLQRAYAPRDYCTQYREADLQFVQRILAEEGIAYVFETAGETETLVLVDGNAGFRPIDVETYGGGEGRPLPLVPLIGEQQDEASTQSVQYLDRIRTLGTRKWSVAAWDWKSGTLARLRQDVELEQPGTGAWGESRQLSPRRLFEAQQGTGPHLDDVARRVEHVSDRDRRATFGVRGSGNVIEFGAGTTFELTGHVRPELDEAYLLLHVTHRGDCPDVEPQAAGGGAAGPQYDNEFRAQPLHLAFRPPLFSRPRIQGAHTAVVVGPRHEEIHTDGLGRVRIRMLWDDDSAPDVGSCWVRVSQAWAGAGWGTLFVPRIGMEVVVTFLGGDPDRPIVTGCLYHGAHDPPWSLPGDKTCSGIRTRSSPGGEGHNELRFDDAADREQVYLHAQRNLDEVVRSCHSTRVGLDRTLEIGRDRTTTVKGVERVLIEGDRHSHLESHHVETVKGTHTLHVTGEKASLENGKVGAARFIDGEYLLEVRDKITIRCQSSVIELRPDGISISAPSISVACPPAAGGPAPTTFELTDERVELHSPDVAVKSQASLLRMRDETLMHSDKEVHLLGDGAQVRLAGEALTKGKNVRLQADDEVRLTGKQGHLRAQSVKVVGERSADLESTTKVSVGVGASKAVFDSAGTKIN